MNREPAVYRPMNEVERARALHLGSCSFPIASFSKRFAREIAAQARERGEITERQASRLAIQCFIYRRQFTGKAACLAPDAPPPGYETPRQRELSARLDSERRRVVDARGSCPMPSASEPLLFPTNE